MKVTRKWVPASLSPGECHLAHEWRGKSLWLRSADLDPAASAACLCDLVADLFERDVEGARSGWHTKHCWVLRHLAGGGPPETFPEEKGVGA